MRFRVHLLAVLLSLNAAFAAPVTNQDIVAKIGNNPIEPHFDLPYAGNSNPRQMVDLYLPKDRKESTPLPVVVFIHGGAWIGGDRKQAAGALGGLMMTGNYAGVSVGYRMSTEAKWPAQIHDCKAAIRWIRGNAAKYNLNPDRIAVWGTSAGGHLVSLLGTSGGVQELEGTLGEFTQQSSRVKCVANFCGPEDLTLPLMNKDGQMVSALDDPAVVGLLGEGDRTVSGKAASPLTYVTADDAPFLTAHGTKDMRVSYEHAELIDKSLKKAGVTSLLIPLTNGGHNFQAPELNKRLFQFFEWQLRDQKADISTEAILVTP
ncbi:MAG TPA: alpha/beta hydrolase [Verrucomicrobium sp.]|nr:alpha/beta hydrolase [Verrucomicrobium sp.]